MSLARFLDQLRAEVPAPPAVSESLRLAGRDVTLRFGSARLGDRLVHSLRHLRHAPGSPPDLTIDCWEADDPAAPGRPPGWSSAGTVYREDGPVSVSWQGPDGPLVVYDRAAGRSWVRYGGRDSVSLWEMAYPFRMVLHWWAADLGMQLVHAAAVGNPRGGVLLVGRGGSGKSTTALACLDAMLGYAGDDYCLVDSGEQPGVHALYLSGRGDTRTAALLPGLREALRQSPYTTDDKSIIFADEVRPAGLTRGFPLRAIVVPEIVGGPSSRLEPLAQAEALRALAPSTLLQLPGRRAGSLGRLSRMALRVPAWKLCLGGDPATAVPALASLLPTDP